MYPKTSVYRILTRIKGGVSVATSFPLPNRKKNSEEKCHPKQIEKPVTPKDQISQIFEEARQEYKLVIDKVFDEYEKKS